MVKCICISDTHGIHDYYIDRKIYKLSIEETGDIFIHAGDFCNTGELYDILSFNAWLRNDNIFDKFKYVILILGNHDRLFEIDFDYAKSILDERIILLHDSGYDCNGIYIYGSAWTLPFNNWAFNVSEDIIKKKLSNMEYCDVLVTHGPAYGILDKAPNKYNLGSKSLYNIIDIKRPKIHICGHIHHSYGYYKGLDTEHYNVSLLNEAYNLVNKPTIINI